MKTAIWGAGGTIGRSVAAELTRRQKDFRLVGRSAEKLRDIPGGEIVTADVAEPGGCAKAAEGADAIVYALGLPYTKKAFAQYPPMMRLAIAAARAARVQRFLLITNVYAYGKPRAGPVTEEHPREPASVKGRYRKEQEDVLLAAHGDTLETVSLRLPDFYGPYAELSISHQIFDAAAKGTTANVLGPIDAPHEFVFTPDVGPVVCDLLEADGDACGQGYNLAGPGTITFREFAEKAFAAFGKKPKLRVAGPGMVRVLGVFSELMRELSELSYLLTDPVILDDSKLRKVLPGLRKTEYAEGIRQTARFYHS